MPPIRLTAVAVGDRKTNPLSELELPGHNCARKSWHPRALQVNRERGKRLMPAISVGTFFAI